MTYMAVHVHLITYALFGRDVPQKLPLVKASTEVDLKSYIATLCAIPPARELRRRNVRNTNHRAALNLGQYNLEICGFGEGRSS